MSEVVIDTSEPVEYMLTTVDNPFDPFTSFDEWMEYDIRMGYNTASFLARIAKVSDELSEPDQQLAIQNAINEIIQENVSGMWRKVSRSSEINKEISLIDEDADESSKTSTSQT